MKRGVWILGAALAAGIAGFAVMRFQSTDHAMAAPRSTSLLPELEWLRHEFDLTEAQFAKVAELHLAYRPTCEALCIRVMTSHEQIRQLVEAGLPITPELELALKDHAALHVECQTAMINHLHRTAECLTPEQAKRYLVTMLPHVIGMEMEPAGH